MSRVQLPEIYRVNKISEPTCTPLVNWVVGRLHESMPLFKGSGIVMVAGGKYLREAYVNIRLMRRRGTKLPIQVWHLGPREVSDLHKAKFQMLDVEFVDAFEVRKIHPIQALKGWECKSYAVKHCPWQHVLLLDADSHPSRLPEWYFENWNYQATGAILFPDICRNRPHDRIFPCLGLKTGSVDEHEAGQVLIDKVRHWKAVCLTVWMNHHSKFFYSMVMGDKDLWGLALAKLGIPFTQAPRPGWGKYGEMLHYWMDGTLAFEHFMERKRNPGIEIPIEHQELFNEFEPNG